MNSKQQRMISATIFVLVMLLGLFSGKFWFAVLFFVILLICLFEFFKLRNLHSPISIGKGILLSIIPFIFTLWPMLFESNFSLLSAFQIYVALFLIFLIHELFTDDMGLKRNSSEYLFATLYLGVSFSCVNIIYYEFIDAPWILLGILLLTWSNDTFAYVVGSRLGKNKLFPSVSPKKTWEGSLGGFFMTLISAFIVFKITGLLNLKTWILIAVIASIFGTIGDLIESKFKRNAGVKDSGSLMPGHGGMLDRFDAFVLIIPVVCYYLVAIHPTL